MTGAEWWLKLIEIAIWPATVLVIALTFRSHLAAALSGGKIKVSIFGVELEIPLHELETITSTLVGGHLNEWQYNYLKELVKQDKTYQPGEMSDEDKELIRPMMRAALVTPKPLGAHLGKAESISLTQLGVHFMKAAAKKKLF
ncbi:MAG TPA: hypothetical protein VFG99_03110 [Chloroflexia bacterium]|nr:hypothetical protein [Chloroflexia bacterium]